MTATATSPANRLATLNAVLDKLPPGEGAREYPELWNERAALLRKQAEEERLDAERLADRKRKNVAAAFTPNIEEFRQRAQAAAKPFEARAKALEESIAGIKALDADYKKLFAEGREAGVKVPSLAELLGVSAVRVDRVQLAVHLLTARD